MLKIPVTKLPRKPCFATVLLYSTVKITSEKIRYFFTVEKYQFYSHLICIEFTACDKINRGYLLFSGEYQIYFIECGEKNSVFFTSA